MAEFGLECLFSLVFAALQARHCVVGWMQVYGPGQLRRLVRSVSFASRPADWQEVQAYRERVLPYVWLQPSEFRWDGIVEALIRPSGERAAEAQGLFSNLWKRLARDFANESFNDEYNGMKHGLRTGPGGFRFSLTLGGSPEEAILANESEHGSSFFVRRAFVEEPYEQDRPARQSDRLFRVRRHLLNWDPEGLCDALALISASIHDVRNWLLASNGADVSALGFELPPKEAFRGPLGLVEEVSFSGIDLPVVERDVEMLGAEEIRQRVAAGMRELRDRRASAAAEET